MHATARIAPMLCHGLFSATTALLAQSGPPPIPVELRARFGFDGPLVVKIGDGLDNLQIADVDGDGVVEAVAIDARRARLVLVRVRGREAELQTMPTSGQINGYTVADVHGDGKPDFLLVDGRGRLTIRHPGDEAATTPLDLGLGGRALQLLPGDLDGDGKADLVAIGRGNLRVLTLLGSNPRLLPIEPCEENAYAFHLTDVDGDGRLDLVAAVPGTNMSLRLRLGRGDGTFGPWRLFGIESLHDVFPARTADGKPALGTIAGPTRAVSLWQWSPSSDQQMLDWWSFGDNAAGKSPPWAIGDIDRDGDEDLVVARPDRAQLAFYEWTGETFVVRTVPTLAGVAAVAIGDVDRDGSNDIVLTSPEEETLAWVSGQGPLDRFPTPLPCTDKPVAATIDPSGGVLVLTRNEKREAQVQRSQPDQPSAKLVDLGRLPADPIRLLVGEFGDAAGLEVAFVVPGEGLRTLTLAATTLAATTLAATTPAATTPAAADKKNGKATEVAGFTKKLEDGAVTVSSLHDQATLLAVRERFVRNFRLDQQGQVRVLAQDNGPDGATELALATDVGDGTRFYLDKKANKLVRVRPSAPSTTVEVPAFDFTYLVGHRGGALLLGPRGILRVPFAPGASMRSVASHEPPIVRTSYASGRSGDFDHDGTPDLLLLDLHLPGVQVLAGVPGGLQRALAIPVFEVPPSTEPDDEPRAMAIGDLDRDGRTDFVLIAHDRILIYLQEP